MADTQAVESWVEAQMAIEQLIKWLIETRGPKDAGAVVASAIYEAGQCRRAISPNAADEFLAAIRESGVVKKRRL